MTAVSENSPAAVIAADDAPELLSRAWWLACADLRYGIWSTWLLLLFTVIVAVCPIEFAEGPRATTPATLFAWLPPAWLGSGEFFLAVRVAVVGGAVLWALRIGLPWVSWWTVFFATLYWSLRMENLANGAHIFNAINMLLLVHAIWFHFYHRQICRALAGDTSLRCCYPRWVFLLCLFYLGWFHSLAGWTKIAASGFDWGDGVSLQLWVWLFGYGGSPFGQLLLMDSRLTAWFQTGALFIESASFLVIFHRSLRYAIGIGLFGFYLGVLTTFVTFGFHFNAALVFWFLLPVDRWVGLRFSGPPVP